MAELAYGHHRHIALKEEFGEDYKVSLNIRDLDDALMIQIMARENMDEWASNALIIQETVRATAGGGGPSLERGFIDLPKVGWRCPVCNKGSATRRRMRSLRQAARHLLNRYHPPVR